MGIANVLVVDDDDFTRMALAAVLRSIDFDVVTQVGTVVAAMEAARTHRPDCVVLDLDLGEGPTGIDLAHGLRRLHRGIGLVMVSSYVEPRFIGQRARPLPSGTQLATAVAKFLRTLGLAGVVTRGSSIVAGPPASSDRVDVVVR